MKNLTFKIIIPLTVISFAVFTKWWYALPVDAPDTMFRGFPLAYACDGWHTSLSLQIFVTEFIVDILIYFVFWFIFVFCIDRFLIKIKTHKWVTRGLWTISGLIIVWGIFLAINFGNNVFYIKRPFKMQVGKTGYHFIWQKIERPDYYECFPEEKSY